MNKKESLRPLLTAVLLCAALLCGCAAPAASGGVSPAEAQKEEASAAEAEKEPEEAVLEEELPAELYEGEDPEPEAEPAPSQAEPLPAPMEEEYEMNAEAFMLSNEHRTWWKNLQEHIEASVQNQGDMDAFYAQALPRLLENGEENAVCSPLSVYLALSMLAECAGGETQAQILALLQAEDMAALQARAEALTLANSTNTPVIKSLLGNSLWIRNDLSYREDTLQTLADTFRADVFSGVMGSPEFNAKLQEWTNEHTGNLLTQEVSGLGTDPASVLELISTIYFKAAWNDPFWEETTTETFHAPDGDADCHMMHMSLTTDYYWGEKFAALSLPLQDGDRVTFFLPDEGVSPAELTQDAQALSLTRKPNDYENAKHMICHISVPRFTVREKQDLSVSLQALGITDAFSPSKADFSALTDALQEVWVSAASHAAMVQVDEQGITGAAYTDLALAGAAAPPDEEVDFVLDRPFFFTVTGRDKSLLFAGIVQNPS